MTRAPKDHADSGDESTVEPGTDLATVTDVADGEIVAAAERAAAFVFQRGYGPRTTELIQYIASRTVDEADLNVVITEQLAERLLNATSMDDILQPFDPEQGKRYYGRTIYIQGVSFIESDYEGFPWYVSLQCKRPDTGETFVLTIGGEKIVLQVAAAERAGLLPLPAKIHQAEKETRAGFRPLELRPAISS